jgi:hypothetical protein
MDQVTATAIFAKAADAADWKRTSRGLSAEIPQGGFTWTVRLPQEGEGRAYISGSSGWGGETGEYIEATGLETIRIVEAAMAATRLP